MTDLGNPWRYVVTNIVIWVIVACTFEMVLFEGELTIGVLTGVTGGLTTGILRLYFNDEI